MSRTGDQEAITEDFLLLDLHNKENSYFHFLQSHDLVSGFNDTSGSIPFDGRTVRIRARTLLP